MTITTKPTEVERAIPFLLRRLKGLENTPYARSFLTSLSHNATLLSAADGYGLVPDAVNEIRHHRADG